MTEGGADMKIAILMFALFSSVVAFAQDVHFSKQELIEIVAEPAAEAACTENFVNCIGITTAVCTKEVVDLANGTCSKQIPAEGGGKDAIGELVPKFVNCVVPGLMAKYKKNIQKNALTPACQSFMK